MISALPHPVAAIARAGRRACACAAVLAVALGVPAFAAAPPEGSLAPTFSLPALSSAPLSSAHWTLANARGRVVVVNFFATWCPPCRAETPDLVAVEKRYASKDVIFVGVDDEENPLLVSVFAKSKGIRYPIVLDGHGGVARAYDVRAIPTTYVLDGNRVIRYRQVDQLNAALLSGVIDAVLAGRPVPESVASRKFHHAADEATAQIRADLRAATSSTAPDTQALDAAIALGVKANKRLDTLLSQPDASSISYFSIAETRSRFNEVLADAYDARAAALSGSLCTVSDQTEAALLRGQILSDQERFSEAAVQYSRAMQLSPKDRRAYDGAYLAAYELKNYSQASDIARAEAAIAPNDPESWLTVASSQNLLKQYPAALEAERKALALASEAYAKNPTSKPAAYELGRVWLKTARTQLLAGNEAAARPLLLQASAAAPATIVAEQADEQYAALEPAHVAIDASGSVQAYGKSDHPAAVYVVVRNPLQRGHTVNLKAAGLPAKWLLSFCYSTVCNPYKVSFALPSGGSRRIELLLAPLAQTNGPWSMHVSTSGGSTANVRLDAKTVKAAITITAS